jgi:branched-chain amino acid transport system ATP-binding protein
VVRNLGVSFAGVVGLRDVDLELHTSEVVGLIGPNGAGKSTLLNLITGYVRPGIGSIFVDGTDITRWGPARTARIGVARTFQSVRTFRNLSVTENLEVAALGVGLRPVAAATRAAHLIEQFELGSVAHVAAGSLSYGLERRVGISRALATHPKYVLLDEPAAGMNDAERDELGRLLAALPSTWGCGVLVIEHDLDLILGLCGRVHVLDSGETIYEGSAAGLFDSPVVRSAYLGSEVA